MVLSPIKYTGSKRKHSTMIVSKFPSFSGIYYEPFVGGGSVLLEFLSQNEGSECVASDINPIVIDTWNLIKNNPHHVMKEYLKCYDMIEDDVNNYYSIRDEFNKNKKDVAKFIFLTRTSINGLVRFSRKGDFNASKNPYPKNGMKPELFEEVLFNASNLVQNTTFKVSSYEKIIPKKNDLIYFDPPYLNSEGMYLGNIDLETFWEYIRSLKCKWLLSFDGKVNGEVKAELDIPYKNMWFMEEQKSNFKKIKSVGGKKRSIQEALYANF